MNFHEIEEDYLNTKKRFQNETADLVARSIASEIKPFDDIFSDVFSFLIEAFKGKIRNDGKTPLVFHSIYLVKILYMCGERNIDTLLIGALHDVLEDTHIKEDELRNTSFLEDRSYIIDNLKILVEDKSLSREPDGKNLPPRYVEHIGRIVGSNKEVINVEIIDRFSDLMDLEYILELPSEERKLRLKSKLIKVKSFVYNITRERNDFNGNCLDLFNYKVNEIEAKYQITTNYEVIF